MKWILDNILNMLNMEKQWITLFPDTFLWFKKNYGFLYSTKEFKGYKFRASKSLKEICEDLLLPHNLYSTTIYEIDNDNEKVKEWISLVTEKYKFGFITPCNEKRPVSLMPILKMTNKFNFYEYEHRQGIGGSIMHNIHELVFYINSSDFGDNFYYKQVPYPMKNCSILDLESILLFARYSQNPFLSNINLVGNIFKYPDYQKLLKNISGLTKHCTILITYQDFIFHFQEFNNTIWPENISFNLIIDSLPIYPFISLQDINPPISLTLLVFSKDNYDKYFDLFKNEPIYCNPRIIPLYDGDNIKFFEESLYTNLEDINDVKLIKREIFLRQTLNLNDFGILTIIPDGTVFANVNMPPLGKIKDSVYSLVYKEFSEGSSWLRIRTQKPCSDCHYQWLCPSPSNYELVIGKPNLCHILE